MTGPDDPHPGPAAVLHAHADAYGDSSNDTHDKYNSKHDASNCRAREDIPNIGIVGATVRCGPITAVRSAVIATLSKAIICVDDEQDQLRKQDSWTHGQLPRIHPKRWPEVARQDRWTERLEPGLRVKGEPGTGRGWRRSDRESCAPERGVARRPSHCPGSLRGEPRRPRRAVLVPPSLCLSRWRSCSG